MEWSEPSKLTLAALSRIHIATSYRVMRGRGNYMVTIIGNHIGFKVEL